MKYSTLTENEEFIGKSIVHAAYQIHKEIGPGLLEKVYELCMLHELMAQGFHVKRQAIIPIKYKGIHFDEGLRLDLLVNNAVIVEIKAMDTVNAVWEAQILSQLKLSELKLGYLINFNVVLIKNGIRRFRM
ncbi:MAG: GxxExxY protein [Saprospiraceae bacterium]|nr:GxxExxY protein [Saprospiraceae bacterium]